MLSSCPLGTLPITIALVAMITTWYCSLCPVLVSCGLCPVDCVPCVCPVRVSCACVLCLLVYRALCCLLCCCNISLPTLIVCHGCLLTVKSLCTMVSFKCVVTKQHWPQCWPMKCRMRFWNTREKNTAVATAPF